MASYASFARCGNVFPPTAATWRRPEPSGRPLPPSAFGPQPRPEEGASQVKAAPPPNGGLLEREIQLQHGRLYRAALRQLRNPADAEDALQDALLLAYRHFHQFAGRSSLRTWLTRIVINSARSHRRRSLAHPQAALDDLPLAQRLQPDSGPGPEALCVAREQRERLQHLLKRLSPPLRGAVELHDLAGNSVSVAARALGVTPATLKCRLFRARRRLQAMARYA